jgi:hypothetical protein
MCCDHGPRSDSAHTMHLHGYESQMPNLNLKTWHHLPFVFFLLSGVYTGEKNSRYLLLLLVMAI